MEVRKVLTGLQIKYEDKGMQSIHGEHPEKKYRVLILGDVTNLSFWHLGKFMIAYPLMDKGNEIMMHYKDNKLVIKYYNRDD